MGRLNDGSHDGGPSDIRPGETRTILAKDKQGNVIKTMTLYRTDRDYIHDLCDCYNAHRLPGAVAQGMEWYVHNGELKIGLSAEASKKIRRDAESRLETERARYIRHHLENTPA